MSRWKTGCCWRCDSEVEQKELEQWFFKITNYAQELLDRTWNLQGWPEPVLTMQRNWIGRSTGCEIDFPLENSLKTIRVFTTRQDTLFGATFMSLAPEHPMAAELTIPEAREAVEAFIAKVKKQDKVRRTSEDFEKEGVFTGSYCINPVTRRRMPVYLANFVLMDYGTGAVMAVPTHDQRDFEFARKYDLPLSVVIQPQGEELRPETMAEAWTGPGVMANSDRFDGLNNEEAKEKIADFLEKEGIGKKTVNSAFATGASPASATGERRFRSSTVTSAGWFRCRRRICRSFCPATSNSPGRGEAPWPSSKTFSMSPAPSAVRSPGGKPIPSIRSLKAPGISPDMPVPTSARGPSTVLRRNTGCRWTSISAESSMPSCIFSTPAFLPRCCGIWG